MNMREWWDGLLERERRIVSVGSVIVAVLLVYALIWSPLSDSVLDRKTQIVSQKQLLVFLRHASEKIVSLRASGVVISADGANNNLLGVVEQTLASQQLSSYLKQIQQADQNQIELMFKGVPFDKFMQWLQVLIVKHDLHVARLTATRLGTIGTVDVQLSLKGAA